MDRAEGDGGSRTRRARERDERVHFLFDACPAMYFEVDAAGTIASLTRYGAEHLGYSVVELVGRPLTEIVHPTDRETVRSHLEECGRTREQLCRWEFRKVCKDGSVMWVREVVRPVRDADGQLVFLVACDDVTDEKRVEAERERLLARQQFLDEARRVLAASLDYEATLKTVARLSVPVLGDLVIVDVIGEEGGLRRIAVALANPEQETLAREAEGSPPDLALKDHPVNRAIRTRHSQILSGEEAMRAAAFSAEQFDVMRRLGPRSVLVVPLIARGRALGAIVFISLTGESARAYGPEDVPLAEELARSAGVAIDNARLYAEAEQRAREETGLREAVGALSAALSTHELIRRIATSAVKATGAHGASVTMIDAERGEVEVIAVAGEVPLPEGRIPYAHSYTRKVIEHGEPLRIRHFAEADGRLRESPLARACPECSADATPLIANERPIGALFIMSREEPPALSPESRTRLRTFGELASLAFRRLQLLEESERRRKNEPNQ